MKSLLPIIGVVSPLMAANFFIDDNWTERSAPTFPLYHDTTLTEPAGTASVLFKHDSVITKIGSGLFGNNSNAYMGNQIVTSSFALKHLKNAAISYMRLPGGNWSNIWMWDHTLPTNVQAEYLPLLKSAPQVNWTMKTDTLYALADSIHANLQPCVNYSLARFYTGTDRVNRAAQYAANWVRDLQSKGKKAPYWEVGNENYGKWQAGYTVTGLDTISGTEYGTDFGIFADSMKTADPTIKVGAVIFPTESGYRNWSAGVLGSLNGKADYLIIHEYFTYAPDINTVPVDSVIASVSKIKADRDSIDLMQKKYFGESAEKLPVMVSEFNLRCGTKQMTMLAPIFQTMALNEFARNDFGMVNIWDIANGYNTTEGDHGILTRKHPTLADFTPMPGFFTYYFMTKFTGDRMISASSSDTTVRWYGTSFSDGSMGITAVNPYGTPITTSLSFESFFPDTLTWFTLSADSILSPTVSINGVKPTATAGGPELYDTIAPYRAPFTSGSSITIPPYSCVYGVLSQSETPVIHSSANVTREREIRVQGNSLQFRTASPRTVELYSLKGQKLRSLRVSGIQCQFDNIGSGVYTYRVVQSENIITGKIQW